MVSGSLASISSLLLVAVIIASGPSESEAIIDSFWNYFRAGSNMFFDEGRNHTHQHQRDQSSEEFESTDTDLRATSKDQGQNSFRERCACILLHEPVCANNGITYVNECEFNCAKRQQKDLEILWGGRCLRVYKPVCANNGMTYRNECEFKCAKKQQKDLKIRRKGECRRQKD